MSRPTSARTKCAKQVVAHLMARELHDCEDAPGDEQYDARRVQPLWTLVSRRVGALGAQGGLPARPIMTEQQRG
jgi:hypothetical protein